MGNNQIIIKDHFGRETKLSIDLDETIGSAKKRYINQLNLNNDVYWHYEGFELKDNEKFKDIGIKDNAIIKSNILLKNEIQFISNPRVTANGGPIFGISMADISNKKGLVKGNFNKDAKNWNIIVSGLNVSGICNNNRCKAYKKLVDCQIGLGTFDLVRDADRIKCPMCKKEMEPKTCCFSECQYKIEGKKKSNGKTESVKTKWKRVEKDYEYYDPNKSGIVNWLMLIIQTKRL